MYGSHTNKCLLKRREIVLNTLAGKAFFYAQKGAGKERGKKRITCGEGLPHHGLKKKIGVEVQTITPRQKRPLVWSVKASICLL